MRKVLSVFLLMCGVLFAAAQTTTLTFTGRDANNHFIPLNRVVISNLTKGWQETIFYPDTILVMGSVGIDDYDGIKEFQLSQNAPNPFDGNSDFSLCLPQSGKVTLEVNDLNGKKITSYINELPAGCHVFRVLLSTPQSYVLTARCGKDFETIKMVNTGNAGANALHYLGEGNMRTLSVELNNAKGQSQHPFTIGDLMEYVGYANIDGIESESQRILQQQGSSQTFILQFSGTQVQLATSSTDSITNVTQNSATCCSHVISDGGASVTTRGVCWSTNQYPTMADNHTTDGSGTGSFTSSMTGLAAGTTYYVRAYATNSMGTAYGNQVSFTTTQVYLPTVTTNSVTNITENSATCGGNVTADGGASVTARGFCWSTNQYPTIADNHTTDGSGTGSFTSSMTGLSAGTTYYVRAYATNSGGTAYGNQVSFTTTQVYLPTVTTNSVANITENSATCGGNVTADGGYSVIARGVCWSTSQNPTIADNHTTDGSGTGSFTSSMTGLSVGTTYYVRAYATNSAGTVYGNQVSFTTTQVYLPTVTTNSVTNITENSATCGGNVTADGGASVTARGFCWSTNQYPTIADNHTTDGSGTGSFTSSMTGLSAGTTYYVRAYATNNVGTAYGNQVSFTTTQVYLPTVTTNSVTNITENSATCGGNVTADVGYSVIARGVCWSTSQNPTMADNHTTDGSGTGSFTSSMTGLSAGTTYYVRAYATNSEGTAYGNQVSFTTTQVYLPTVTTNSVTNITENSATCGGNVTFDGGASVTARGVCWSTNHNPTIANSHTTNGSGTGSFTSSMTGLSAGTTYYVRAYATNSVGTAYGNEYSVITHNIPTVTTQNVTDISNTTATCGGNVTDDGGANVTARGVCWRTNHYPTIADSHTTNGSGTGSFTSSMTGLSAGTTYYVRAYATNSVGTAYGNEYIVITHNIPTVTTQNVTDVSYTTATCGGNVTSDGGTNVTARGVCWSTSQNPTIADTHTTNGTGTENFTSSITGLTPNTTYYVRAYATNSVGTAYGNQVSFTTAQVYLPTVTTNSVTNITENSATCGGNVTFDGGANVTVRGVCWSTSQNPTIADSHTADGSGMGSFANSMTELSAGTTYYVRAYATNSVGTSYGNQVSFTTPCAPAVTTTSVTNITQNSATCGGNVTSNGGASVTARGVCWSTSQNPTISNSHTADGSGTGSFSSSITGLSPNTTYYVRAYATNSVGTSYGNQVSFTTATYPTVTTGNVSNITWHSGTCGGNVTSDGGSNVTARGVCWSTSQNPTISNSHTTNGSGTGSFSSSLTDLSPNTTYYVRAYATNSVGTAYGNQVSFTTGVNPDGQPCSGTPTVTDVDNNTYNTVQIGNQCWMKENLRTTRYADGTSISLRSGTSTTTAYRYCLGNHSSNVITYGYLYNWKAVMRNSSSSWANPSGVQGICPAGWHVPSDAEWMQLTDYVSSQSGYVCGNDNTKIAKALASTTGWSSSSSTCTPGNNPSANNATGFSAVPAGGYNGNYTGGDYGFGDYAFFWSATQDGSAYAYARYLSYSSADVSRSNYGEYYGFSVRCLRD